MRDIFSIAYQGFGSREKISIVPRAKRSRGTLSRRHHRRMLPVQPPLRLLEPKVHQFLSWHQWHHMNFSLISFQAHLYDKSFWLTYFVNSDHYSKLSYRSNHDSMISIPKYLVTDSLTFAPILQWNSKNLLDLVKLSTSA